MWAENEVSFAWDSGGVFFKIAKTSAVRSEFYLKYLALQNILAAQCVWDICVCRISSTHVLFIWRCCSFLGSGFPIWVPRFMLVNFAVFFGARNSHLELLSLVLLQIGGLLGRELSELSPLFASEHHLAFFTAFTMPCHLPAYFRLPCQCCFGVAFCFSV